MDPADRTAVTDAINLIFDDGGIQTAGWIPGDDWSGKVWNPIYVEAARQNHELAGRIFGLFVLETVMNRDDRWITGRFEKDGVPIGSRTYFKALNEFGLHD